MSRFDPREWTIQRMMFAVGTLLGQLLILTAHGTRAHGHEETVLVRKPGRNAYEIFTAVGLLATLYASALLGLLSAAGSPAVLTIALVPVIPFAVFGITVGGIVAGGLTALLAERIGLPIDRIRVSGFVNLLMAMMTAAGLAVSHHWTRWVGIAWFALAAINLASALLILALRPWFRRTSEEAWKDTAFVD